MDSSDMNYSYPLLELDFNNFPFESMDDDMSTPQDSAANSSIHNAESTAPELAHHLSLISQQQQQQQHHRHRYHSVSPTSTSPGSNSPEETTSLAGEDDQSHIGTARELIPEVNMDVSEDFETMQLQQQLRYYGSQHHHPGQRAQLREQIPARSSSAEFYSTPPDNLFMSPINIPESGAFDAFDEGQLIAPLISPATTPIYHLLPQPPTTAQSSEHFSPLSSPVLRPQTSNADASYVPPKHSSKRNYRGAELSAMKVRQGNGRVSPIGRRLSGPIITSTPISSSMSVPATLNAATYQQHAHTMMRPKPVNNGRMIAMSSSQTNSLMAATNTIHQLSPGSLVKSQPSPPAFSASISAPPAYLSMPQPSTRIPIPISISTSHTIPTSLTIPASILPATVMPPPPTPTTPTTQFSASATTHPILAPMPVTPGSLMNLSTPLKPSKSAKQPVPVLPVLTGFPIAPAGVPTNAIPTISIPSPSLKPTQTSPVLVPVSPSGGKQLISPSLKPKTGHMLSSLEAAERLATKSNYRILADGETAAVGITYTTDIHSGIELRRTSHKAAEQKRRDSLKRCFDDLRGVIPDVTERNPSKVYLLKKSYDYIVQLKTQGHSKDRRILSLKSQIREMRERLGLPVESDDEDDETEKSGEGFKQEGMSAMNETDDEGDSDDEHNAEGESTSRKGVKHAKGNKEGAREARTDAGKGGA